MKTLFVLRGMKKSLRSVGGSVLDAEGVHIRPGTKDVSGEG
jgi:hypothetical protein